MVRVTQMIVLAGFVAACVEEPATPPDASSIDAGRGSTPRCVPGASSACTCTDGSAGAQLCLADGALGECRCEGSLGCASGERVGCSCDDGRTGAQLCGDGVLGDCICSGPVPGVPTCVPGMSVSCACTDGSIGAQPCNLEATFDACVCAGSGLDGGVQDSGSVDAGDAGLDAGVDAGMDSGPADGGIDAMADAMAEDAGMDAPSVDAGADAGLDAGGSDAGPDGGGSDSGMTEAGFDSGSSDSSTGPEASIFDVGPPPDIGPPPDVGPPPVCPDAAANVLAGSATIENAADAAALDGITRITGDVTINAPGLSSLELTSLVQVDGTISWVTGPTELGLACLRFATDVHIEGVDVLDATSLERVESALRLDGTGAFLLPRLTFVTDLRIAGSGSYRFPALDSVIELSVESGTAIFDLLRVARNIVAVGDASYFFPSLTRVSQRLDIMGFGHYYFAALDQVRSLEARNGGGSYFPVLTSVTGQLTTWGSKSFPALVDVNIVEARGQWLHVPQLVQLGPVFRSYNVRVDAPLLELAESTDFEFWDGGELNLGLRRAGSIRYTAVTGQAEPVFELPSLEHVVSEFRVSGANGLDIVRMPLLDSVGSLAIENHGANRCAGELSLSMIDFPSLAEVTSTSAAAFRIRDNQNLPFEQATGLRDQVLARRGIAGGVEVLDDFVPLGLCPTVTILSPTEGESISRSTSPMLIRVTVDGVAGGSIYSRLNGDASPLPDLDGDGVFEGFRAITSGPSASELFVSYRPDLPDETFATVSFQLLP